MNIWESQLGQDFLAYQMPALIAALEKLAKKPAYVPLQIPETTVPGILRDFYNGTFHPVENLGDVMLPAYKELGEKLRELEREIRSRISPEEWILVEQYCHTLVERDGVELEMAFETGYRTATQLLVAGLTLPKEDTADEV